MTRGEVIFGALVMVAMVIAVVVVLRRMPTCEERRIESERVIAACQGRGGRPVVEPWDACGGQLVWALQRCEL